MASRPAMIRRVLGRRSLNTWEVLDSQVNVLQNGKTNILQGRGGRSSRSGYVVTVFGAPGYVGTELVTKLAQQGTLTVTPYRDEAYQRHLKLTGDLGVVNRKEFDLRNIESIEHCVAHSDVVVNLLGRDWETKNFSFEDVHIEGARRIASAAKKYGVPRFVHMSSHSVDVNSPSKFLATKAEGENVVRDIYPDATIVRPGPVFGIQDHFVDPLSSQRLVLAANEGRELLRPTWIKDLGAALEKIVYNESSAGQLYELNGPEAISLYEVWEIAKNATKKDRKFINLPKPALKAWATFLQYAAYWDGVLTPDMVERSFIDQVVTPGALGYADLGITPQNVRDHILSIARLYRDSRYQSDSAETDKRRKKEQDSYSNIVD